MNNFLFIHNCCSLLLPITSFSSSFSLIPKDPGEDTALCVEDTQMCRAWCLPGGGSLSIRKHNDKYTTVRYAVFSASCIWSHSTPSSSSALYHREWPLQTPWSASLVNRPMPILSGKWTAGKVRKAVCPSALLSAGRIQGFPLVPAPVGSHPSQGGLSILSPGDRTSTTHPSGPAWVVFWRCQPLHSLTVFYSLS